MDKIKPSTKRFFYTSTYWSSVVRMEFSIQRIIQILVVQVIFLYMSSSFSKNSDLNLIIVYFPSLVFFLTWLTQHLKHLLLWVSSTLSSVLFLFWWYAHNIGLRVLLWYYSRFISSMIELAPSNTVHEILSIRSQSYISNEFILSERLIFNVDAFAP